MKNWRIPATLDRLISNIPAACEILDEMGRANLAFQLRQDCANLQYWQDNGGLVSSAELAARDRALYSAVKELAHQQDEVVRLRKANAALVEVMMAARRYIAKVHNEGLSRGAFGPVQLYQAMDGAVEDGSPEQAAPEEAR